MSPHRVRTPPHTAKKGPRSVNPMITMATPHRTKTAPETMVTFSWRRFGFKSLMGVSMDHIVGFFYDDFTTLRRDRSLAVAASSVDTY